MWEANIKSGSKSKSRNNNKLIVYIHIYIRAFGFIEKEKFSLIGRSLECRIHFIYSCEGRKNVKTTQTIKNQVF